MTAHKDLPGKYGDRIDVQVAVFRAAVTVGVDACHVSTDSTGGVTVWLKAGDLGYASEVDAHAFLTTLGVTGPTTTKREFRAYGSYKAALHLSGYVWRVTVYAEPPTEPDVPDEALMAAWKARGDSGCRACTERPCPACAAHLTGIAAAVLKAGAR